MGFTPRETSTSNGGSSESRESVEGNNDRINRDRNRNRNRGNDDNRREHERIADRTAKEEAERRAREAAERKAREEAERKLRNAKRKAKAEQEEAEQKAKIEKEAASQTSLASGGLLDSIKKQGFSGYGNLAGSYVDGDPLQGPGVDIRTPTPDERKMGYTPDVVYSAPTNAPQTPKERAEFAAETLDEFETDVATKTVGNMVGAVMGVPFAGEVAKLGLNAYRELAYDDTGWQKAMKDGIKSNIKGNGLVSKSHAAATGVATYSAVNGSQTAAKVSGTLGAAPVGVAAGMVDDAIALENYRKDNQDYMASHGVDISTKPVKPSLGNDNDSIGILARIKNPVQPFLPAPPQQPERPQFEWISDIDTSWRL